jgi:hypothetical protein
VFDSQQSLSNLIRRLCLTSGDILGPFALGVIEEARGEIMGPAQLYRLTPTGSPMPSVTLSNTVHSIVKEDCAIELEPGCKGIILVDDAVSPHVTTNSSRLSIDCIWNRD